MLQVLIDPGAVVAKKAGRPKRSERDDRTVRIDRRLAAMAKSIADARGTSTAELLSDMLNAPLSRAYADLLRDLEKKGGE